MTDRPVTRREVLVAGAVGTAGLMGGVLGSNSLFAAESKRKPNIIFILADDLGVADVSCYGAPQIRTPAIDSIAKEGALFTQSYANSAVCTASRVALITGRYQYRLAVGLWEPLGGPLAAVIGLPPEQPTLPSILKKAGYETWLIGKWHMGSLPKFGPSQSGYDHFYGFRGGALDYYTHRSVGGPDAPSDLWDGDTKIEQQGYLTELLGQRTVEVIKSRKKDAAPYFISLHFNAPHWPWKAPGKEDPGEKGTLATYNSMVEAMDQQIGQILKALAQTGQANDTIVIFTSDNGGERFSNTWPFTGKKYELLEGGVRVPAVIRWPRHIRKGLVSAQTIMTMDWLPTLTAAAGSGPDPSSPSDGMSMLPTLLEAAAPVSRKLFWRFKANSQRAMRDGDYKILKIADNSFMFNVVEDPLERTNLRSKMPDVYKRMTEEWTEWNKTMLPEDPQSNTGGASAETWADHFGAQRPDRKIVDDGMTWPAAKSPPGPAPASANPAAPSTPSKQTQ